MYKDLAGNAYSGPVFAAVLLSLLKNLPDVAIKFCENWSQSHDLQAHPVLDVKSVMSMIVDDDVSGVD